MEFSNYVFMLVLSSLSLILIPKEIKAKNIKMQFIIINLFLLFFSLFFILKHYIQIN